MQSGQSDLGTLQKSTHRRALIHGQNHRDRIASIDIR
jgi:hypothetical protein